LARAAQAIPNQPVQPFQPLPTEEPAERPGEIPTIDLDGDLPTRPSVQTPTTVPTRPPRQTPTAVPPARAQPRIRMMYAGVASPDATCGMLALGRDRAWLPCPLPEIPSPAFY
jgi:hypothetical protein